MIGWVSWPFVLFLHVTVPLTMTGTQLLHKLQLHIPEVDFVFIYFLFFYFIFIFCKGPICNARINKHRHTRKSKVGCRYVHQHSGTALIKLFRHYSGHVLTLLVTLLSFMWLVCCWTWIWWYTITITAWVKNLLCGGCHSYIYIYVCIVG